jgi:hypothetical protein
LASKDKRRDARLASGDPVRLAWEDAATGPTFVIGKCVDVSAAGLKIEVQVAVPVRARIMVRVESLGLSGSAVVKHSLRRGAKYVIGVELSSGRLAKIREPIEKR